MMENPLGLPHSHTPQHTPISPPTFSRSREKIFFRLFEPEALRGGIYYQYIFFTFSPVIIACPKGVCKGLRTGYFHRLMSPQEWPFSRCCSCRYERFIPVMHFVPISPRCDYCTGGARDYYFSAYIRYGMIADESVNIQAGYAHKTIGFGDISVGIDVNGTPSFSASVATVVPYVARAVTVTY